MSKTDVMVLAGGRGKRMGLLCHQRPKPLLPIAGRARVIDFSLSNAINSGLHDIAVLVDYQRLLLKTYLSYGAAWMVQRYGRLDVLEPPAGSYLGTADAIYQNLHYIEKSDADQVLILAADHVYRMDYRQLIAHHEDSGAGATVAVAPVPLGEARRFGIVTCDGSGRVVGFQEKPPVPRSDLASMGIYVFCKETLVQCLKKDASDNASPRDFGHSIIPSLVRRGKVSAYKFHGYWRDVGEVDSYYRTNFDLLSQPGMFSRDGDWPIFSNHELALADAEDERMSTVIRDGCVLQGRVENSVVCQGTLIEQDAVVRDSILMANCIVRRHSVVDRCILDEGVVIGESSYVGLGPRLGDDGADITVVGKGVAIPPHTAIGRGSKVWPGVAPSDFRSKVVPPDTVLAHVASPAMAAASSAPP